MSGIICMSAFRVLQIKSTRLLVPLHVPIIIRMPRKLSVCPYKSDHILCTLIFTKVFLKIYIIFIRKTLTHDQ